MARDADTLRSDNTEARFGAQQRALFEALTGYAAKPRWVADVCAAVVSNQTRDLLEDESDEAYALYDFANEWIHQQRPARNDSTEPAAQIDPLAMESVLPEQAESTRVRASYSAARAVAHLGRAIDGTLDVADGVDRFLAHCLRAGLQSVGTGPGAPVPTGGPRGLSQVFVHARQDSEDPASGFLILAACELAGLRPADRRSVSMPVLFVTQDRTGGGRERGEVGILRLCHLASGPAGLHPDPEWMAFTQIDDAFAEGLSTAWGTSALSRTQACVVWSVSGDSGGAPTVLEGDSMTGAMAVALDELALSGWSRTMRLRRIDTTSTVSANLEPVQRTLLPVDGYELKLAAARQANLRVVLAGDVDPEIASQYRDEIVTADTLDQAIRATRTRLNVGPWSSTAIVMSLVIALVSFIGIHALTSQQARELTDASARRIAEAANGLRDSNPHLAQQLALAAFRVSDTEEARSALLDSTATEPPIVVSPGALTALHASTDHEVVMTGFDDGTLRLITVTRDGVTMGTPFGGGSSSRIDDITSSRDHRLMAAATREQITLWDTSDASDPRRLVGLEIPEGVISVALRPDGSELIAGTTSEQILRWDLSGNPRLPRPLEPLTLAGGYARVTFNSTGQLLAAASRFEKAIRVWDVIDPQPLSVIDIKEDGYSGGFADDIKFSPDGSVLGIANGLDVSLWSFDLDKFQMATLPTVFMPSGQWPSTIISMAFRNNSSLAAVHTTSDSVEIVELRPGSQPVKVPASADYVAVTRYGLVTFEPFVGKLRVFSLSPLTAHNGYILDHIPLDSGGSTVAARGQLTDDGTRLWDVERASPQQLVSRDDNIIPLGIMDLSPNGDRLAILTASNELQIWDVDNPLSAQRIGSSVSTTDSTSVRFSHDASVALTMGGGHVDVWDVTGTDGPKYLTTIDTGSAKIPEISDGRLLATETTGGEIRLWDITTPAAPRELPPIKDISGTVYAIAFARSRDVLATLDDSGGRLIDLSDPTHPTTFANFDARAVPDGYNELAVSDDASTVALYGGDGIRVWDMADPEYPRPFRLTASLRNLKAASPLVNPLIRFSSTGELFGYSGNFRRWSTDPHAVAAAICASGTTLITSQVWESFRFDVALPNLC
ncbi:hypothetical protein ACFWU5_26775 [Nocardia sp. NPDC058640]|uniref:hypothetical protein n=1 Tax=Nocardia sp. NPDC058640 TaxID=3346571 RepID=UPI003667AD27